MSALRYSNLHTHTTMSDGKNTAAEVLAGARALGLCSLGFSDHSYTAFDLHYCLRPESGGDRYEEVIRDLARRAREEDGFPVFLGVEFDAFSEDRFEGYDYRIGSAHYLKVGETYYAVDHTLASQQECVAKEFHGDKGEYAKRYFAQMVEHARKNRFEIVGHFDVLTKFGFFDEDDPAYGGVYRTAAVEAMAEILRYTPIFEVNTGAMTKGLRKQPYPSPFLLTELRRLGGRVMLSSDSHAAATLINYFDETAAMLRQIGFTHVSRLTGNGFVEDAL